MPCRGTAVLPLGSLWDPRAISMCESPEGHTQGKAHAEGGQNKS